MKMDIAYITNVMYPFVKGGAEKRIYDIGKRLARRGHNVTVYSRHWWDGCSQRTYDGIQLCAVARSRQLRNNSNRRSIIEGIDFAHHAVSKVRKNIYKHDLIVASNAPYYPVFATKLSTLFKNTPFVGIWQEVWKNHWYEYMGTLGVFGQIAEYTAANIPQHHIAASNHTADRLSELGPNRNEISVITNGIDVEQIRGIEPMENGFDLLFVGRISPNKNVDIVMKAFNKVADNYNLTLGIIGEGPELEKLKKIQSDMEHGDKIRFLGFVENEKVLSHMKAAQIFVSPSVREGFGITLVEAMASGCLVITSDHDLSAGSKVVGDAGFCVRPTVSAVKKTVADIQGGKRPKRDPRDAAEYYDWENIVDKEEKVYLHLLEN